MSKQPRFKNVELSAAVNNFFNLNMLQHLNKVNNEVSNKKLKCIKIAQDRFQRVESSSAYQNLANNSSAKKKLVRPGKSNFKNYKIQVQSRIQEQEEDEVDHQSNKKVSRGQIPLGDASQVVAYSMIEQALQPQKKGNSQYESDQNSNRGQPAKDSDDEEVLAQEIRQFGAQSPNDKDFNSHEKASGSKSMQPHQKNLKKFKKTSKDEM